MPQLQRLTQGVGSGYRVTQILSVYMFVFLLEPSIASPATRKSQFQEVEFILTQKYAAVLVCRLRFGYLVAEDHVPQSQQRYSTVYSSYLPHSEQGRTRCVRCLSCYPYIQISPFTVKPPWTNSEKRVKCAKKVKKKKTYGLICAIWSALGVWSEEVQEEHTKKAENGEQLRNKAAGNSWFTVVGATELCGQVSSSIIVYDTKWVRKSVRSTNITDFGRVEL